MCNKSYKEKLFLIWKVFISYVTYGNLYIDITQLIVGRPLI